MHANVGDGIVIKGYRIAGPFLMRSPRRIGAPAARTQTVSDLVARMLAEDLRHLWLGPSVS